MRCGKAVGYIEFDHPKYVPMAIDLSGQLLVGERIEIKPLNADGTRLLQGKDVMLVQVKNICLDKPWHLMTSAERIDSSTDWRELIDVDDRRVFYNKVTGQRWRTIPNDLWRARLKKLVVINIYMVAHVGPGLWISTRLGSRVGLASASGLASAAAAGVASAVVSTIGID